MDFAEEAHFPRPMALKDDSLVVMLSVDWEPDKGAWKHSGSDMDYGGILKGTPVFCGLLDELRIPCTWFIETSYDPRRDLPGCFPEVIRQLGQRQQDEIGLHIHWRRPAPDSSIRYETNDAPWIGAQLDHGVRQFDALGVRPRAFRSGALLHIKGLPRMLSERGFAVDSSTLWGKANRLNPDKRQAQSKTLFGRWATLFARAFSGLPEPYLADQTDVEQRGTSEIVELPITYSLFDASTIAHGCFSRYFRYKALLAGQTQYLMLFFHIDELTSIASGPDEKTSPDPAMLRHFRDHLTNLKNCGARFVTCSTARSRWLGERSSEGQDQSLLIERAK